MEFPDDMPPFHVMRIVKAEAAKREQRIKETINRVLGDAMNGGKPDGSNKKTD